MKNNLFAKTIFSVLCILFVQLASAQMKAPQKQVKQDCYTTYKNQGDVYNNAKNYDLAIQQYQQAKYCNALSSEQRKTLDSLIADVNKKKQMNGNKIIVRKY